MSSKHASRSSNRMAAAKSIPLHNGQRMPTVGFGTWLTNGAAMKAAIDVGYRLLDCAQNYENEGELGEVLEQQINAGKVTREELFITSKLAPIGFAPEDVRNETEKSLKRLRTDYIDLYLMHFPVSLSNEGVNADPQLRWPTYSDGSLKATFIDHMATWQEMEKLVDDGLVKAIGLSNFSQKDTERIYKESRIKPANVQIEIHAWLPNYDLAEFCLKRGISVTAYSPLGSPGRPDFTNMGPVTPSLLDEPLLKEIGDRHNKTPAQVVLRNLMQRGLIVIPKSANPDRMRENMQVWDFELSPDEMIEIKGLNKELRLFAFWMLGRHNFSHPYFPWPELADQCPANPRPGAPIDYSGR